MTVRKYKLDPEEKEIEAAFERGEYVPVENMAKEMQSLRQAAKAHGNLNKRIKNRAIY